MHRELTTLLTELQTATAVCRSAQAGISQWSGASSAVAFGWSFGCKCCMIFLGFIRALIVLPTNDVVVVVIIVAGGFPAFPISATFTFPVFSYARRQSNNKVTLLWSHMCPVLGTCLFWLLQLLLRLLLLSSCCPGSNNWAANRPKAKYVKYFCKLPLNKAKNLDFWEVWEIE